MADGFVDPFGAGAPGVPTTGATPAAPAPAPAQHLSPEEHLKIFGKQLVAKPWWKSLADVVTIPAEGVGNVFGAQERYVTGASNYMYEHPESAPHIIAQGAAGPLALFDPHYRAMVGRGIHAALHPNDPSVEAESEKATGVSKLLSTDPRFRGKLQNFLVETVFQALKDPATYETAALAPLAEGALRGIDIATRGAMVAKNPALSKAARWLATNAPEKIAQSEAAIREAQASGVPFRGNLRAIASTIDESRKAVAAVNTARNAGLSRIRQLSDSDEALIKKYLPEIKQVTQAQMEAPLHKGAALPGFETQPLWADEIERRLDLARPELKEGRYLQPFRSVTERADPESVLRDQLQQSRELLRRQIVRDELEKNLKGIPDREIHALMEARDPAKQMPTTQEILKNIAAEEPSKAGPSWARSISDAQIDAMLATGAPHMRNITVAALMAMPPQDVLKGILWATFNKTPKALVDRLEHGAESHFGLESARSPITQWLEKAGVGNVRPFRAWRHGTGVALDRLDEAYRAARLARADKEMTGAAEFEKLDRVNQDIGAYGLKPTWTAYAPVIGANFPQWHGYIVPTMFARAALRSPGRLANLGRAETNWNDIVFGNQPYRWTTGGPADEGMSAMLDPARVLLGKYPSYFGGQSTAGALSTIFRPSYLPLPERVAQYGLGFIPFGNIASEILMNQFPQVGAIPQGIATGAGLYTQKRTPSSFRRVFGPGGRGAPATPAAAPASAAAAVPIPTPSGSSGFVDPFR